MWYRSWVIVMNFIMDIVDVIIFRGVIRLECGVIMEIRDVIIFSMFFCSWVKWG